MEFEKKIWHLHLPLRLRNTDYVISRVWKIQKILGHRNAKMKKKTNFPQAKIRFKNVYALGMPVALEG